MTTYDMIVIGGGLAGMNIAITAKKKGIKKVVIIEKETELGGTLIDSKAIVNSDINMTGEAYRDLLMEEIVRLDIEVITKATVLKIEEHNRVAYICGRKAIDKIYANTIVLATGAREYRRSPLDLGGNHVDGIYTVDMARKMLQTVDHHIGGYALIVGCSELERLADFKGRLEIIGIVGSGLTAVKNLKLCEYYYEGYEIVEVHGQRRVEYVTIRKGSYELSIECDTVLFADPLICDSILAKKSHIALNDNEAVIVDERYQTSRNGIYACGRCINPEETMGDISKAVEIIIDNIKE